MRISPATSHEYTQHQDYSDDLFECLSRHLTGVIRDEVGVLRLEVRVLWAHLRCLDKKVEEIISWVILHHHIGGDTLKRTIVVMEGMEGVTIEKAWTSYHKLYV